MEESVSDEFAQEVAKLGKLLIAFNKVDRSIYVDMEGTKESDTDHSVMLAVIACAVAESLKLGLDIGKVAQYALVHDLVEVYAGDVSTLDFRNTDFAAKEANEQAALERIKKEFGKTFPWIHQTIEAYESLKDAEARYIKTLDKAMPAITHLYSDGRAVDEGFDDPDAFASSVQARNENMRSTFAHDQEVVMRLREKLLAPTISRKYEKHGKRNNV